MKKLLILFIISISLISCATTKLDILEKSFAASNLDGISNLEYLKDNEDPVIINTNDPENTFLELCSKHNIPIGFANFNGPKFKDFNYLKNYAKSIKAKYVIFGERYNKTLTYQNGSIGPFGGTLTTDNYDIYEYAVCYLVKDNRDKRYGFLYEDLTELQRTQLQQNTGVYVRLVYQNTPAFYSNLIRGDIIIKINDKKIFNEDNFSKELKAVSNNFTFTILRNGVEKVINFEYIQ